VARSTVFDNGLEDLIDQALQHQGFSLVDIWELCTAYFAPNNRFGKPEMMELLEYGGWATGVIEESDRDEYTRLYHRQIAEEKGLSTYAGHPLQQRFQADLAHRLKVMIAGAAGGKIRSAGHLLGQGAILSGLYATQRDDYPVTVKTGHSVCDIILDPKPIGYTGIVRPDALILVSPEGKKKANPRLAAMAPTDRAYVATDLLPVETSAQVIPLAFDRLDFGVRRQNRAVLALGAVLERERWYSLQALQQAVRETQRPEIAEQNLAALDASPGLLS
jgi:Pyruvate/2-oxoacid:ferredoxin oxidoreductase gamma subunit